MIAIALPCLVVTALMVMGAFAWRTELRRQRMRQLRRIELDERKRARSTTRNSTYFRRAKYLVTIAAGVAETEAPDGILHEEAEQ